MKAAEMLERRKVEALERIADALEGVIEMVAQPPKIMVDGRAPQAPTQITTPAPQFVEKPQKKDPLPDDTVEPLNDEETDQ